MHEEMAAAGVNMYIPWPSLYRTCRQAGELILNFSTQAGGLLPGKGSVMHALSKGEFSEVKLEMPDSKEISGRASTAGSC